MSKLSEKYEEFLEELELTLAPFQKLALKETFSNSECQSMVSVCTAAAILRGQEELSKECIREIESFKMKEGE
ncbi:hypothetical protein HWD03_gp055 [Alteromonas phage vB_AmeM_PT11-V22]|uniref:Uncharacterized protein n=1 Tax=Alteromonas phage vB_AmeM_PT11-V22 TaxID=2704031 RepID=A0A6C0R0N1_9CAUD|nr:hypothetical protein HWD03_gp055 [Alteromonas phage vB_AmeM_PT11-V22]QHZ59815.1 hypothetical protein [Alteromonas phage vB_AmeM_PT11-V22]